MSLITMGLGHMTIPTFGLGCSVVNTGIQRRRRYVSFKDLPAGVAIEDKQAKFEEEQEQVRFKQQSEKVEFE